MDLPVANELFRFTGFCLDRRSGGLFREDEAGGSTPVALGARALDVLAVLVARHGELVAKQAIMQAVWPGMLIEDRNLAVQISALRRVLDDGRTEGSCIQTEAGRGYRFVAAVTRGEREPTPLPGVPVSAPPVAEPPADAPKPPMRQSRLRRRTIAGAVAAASVLAVMLAAWVEQHPDRHKQHPTTPSLDRRAAVPEPERRWWRRLSRRGDHRRSNHRPIPRAGDVRHRAPDRVRLPG